ncbi:MAG: hypothetical protein ABI600_20590, partial [Luteolibacter sp.]
ESDTALTLRVLQEDPVSPAWHRPEVPRDLETICLKALQKETADRYASADAMAEDLRRYLDNEPILAQPPTKIVRTVKWVKRHPVRLMGMLLMAAVVGAGTLRWWQWEFYERTHVTLARSLDQSFGLLEAREIISENKARNLATSFRLTRRGRWGPVTSVELLNARGFPATARRIIGGDFLPNWLEGSNGAQNPDERLQETTKIEYAFSGDDLLEVVGRDRNHHITWRMIPDRRFGRSDRSAQGRFVNAFGFEEGAYRLATNIELERDAAGKEVMVHFKTSSGIPAVNREGVYGYKFDRDAKERVVTVTNLGKDDEAAPNRTGMVAAAYTWNESDCIIRADFQDGHGKALLWNGIAAVTSDFDGQGNLLRMHRLDATGKPCNGLPEAWGILENKRNERGEFTEIAYSKVLADGPPQLVSKMNFVYEERGYPTEVTVTAAKVTTAKYLYDPRGNVIEERALDENGKPYTNADNWAIRRTTYEDDPDGKSWRLGTTFFNGAGEKTWCRSGHHKEVITWNLSGELRELATYDHDPERYEFYAYISRPVYNEEGRTIKLVARFENADGKPWVGPWAHSGAETEYDAVGHPVVEWQTGCDVETDGGATIRTEKQWDAAGTMIRKVREICDDKRQPAPFIINEDIASRVAETYNSNGELERLEESGFNQAISGFASRTTTLANGKFKGVIHALKDGTTVPSVKVYVRAVMADAQKGSLSFQPDDQLMRIQDQPVTCVYAWTYGEGFPGGSIDIIRHGISQRLDGFVKGPLGVFLVERADPAYLGAH